MTLDKAFVDLVPVQKNPVDINFAYVPLSRVRRLDDLNRLADKNRQFFFGPFYAQKRGFSAFSRERLRAFG